MEMRRGDIARVLSPLLLFAAHVVYLVVWSPDPFLNKWLDGSFSFFLALVLCNIVRTRVVAAAHRGEEHEGDGKGHGSSGDPDEPPPGP